ncbi:AraC family transcriptional regulator [uncultured Dokdonia sp.]|uniref:AraC family transcriptional regulator n=1 Tax=uncultured Dokdonia sp. TaxID=575653 RepID=UPI002617A086|nr:AraC family transcriptional regulator [uncultured Dokdonia sp.]
MANESYEYLYKKYAQHAEDTTSSIQYLNAYLHKATAANDRIKRSIALNYLSYYTDDRERQFDLVNQSLTESNSVDSLYSIAAYNRLGLYYQNAYDYENALQQYLKVLRLSKKKNDKDYEIIGLNNIADIKKDIGNYKEALILYKTCLDLEQKRKFPNSSVIVQISLNLSESYRNEKKYDSASYYYDLVIDKIYKDHTYALSVAMINEGVNLFYKKNIDKAYSFLQKGASLANLTSQYDLKYYIIAQFYLGKISLISNEKDDTGYFLKVDSLLTKTDLILPEVRDAYVSLIKDYKASNNYKEHLSTINKLIRFDSITNARKIHTTNTLNSEFDTPELVKSKELLIQKLKNKNQSLSTKVLSLLILFVIITFLFFLQIRKHKIYRERFDTIIAALNEKPTKSSKESASLKTSSQSLNIDPDVVAVILDKLLVFESKNGFLKSTITISSLARKLSTNTKYLSKIINTYKGKTFIHYINDLRIEYILNELKVNPTLHRYTILGVAKEASFNSAESFTAAFKKKTGITPSYYIKNLKKSA